jgi:hypothetical protein
MRIQWSRVVPLLILGGLLAHSGALRAQTFRGGIGGSVTDAQQAAVVGARIQAVEDSTGQSRETVSSSAGTFIFQDIALGTYTVTIQASGFESLKVDKVTVLAGSVHNLQLTLSVAKQTQTIEVSANALSLDTTSATQNSVIPEQEVVDAPLNGRDFTQLVAQTPGYTGYSANGTDGSLNGTRINQINWQIDGVDNNDAWHNIPAVNQSGVSGIAGILLPLDAVESFAVQTQSGAEAGRNPGGTVNLALRTGTNLFHGSAYYFDRNELFGAKSPFVATKQKVRNYNAGGSVGGPIVRDRLFFFGSLEKQRFVIGVPGLSTMPSTAYQSQAEALLTEHNVAIDSATQNLLNTLWPASALTGPAATSNYNDPDPEYGYSYNGIFKVDYTINSRNSVSFHWFSGEGNQAAPVGANLLWYYQTAPTHAQNYAVVVNSQFASNISNQVLLGTNYFKQTFSDLNTSFDPISEGFNTGAPILGAPHIKLGTHSQLSQVGLTPPLGRNEITAHITDALSWTLGAHQLRLGGEFRRTVLDEAYYSGERGTFVFDGGQGPWATNPTATDSNADPNTLILADFLGGYLASGSITRGKQPREVFVHTFAGFAQDTWQVRQGLTLNYGVRYDYEGPLNNSNKDLSIFDPAKGGIVFQGAGIDSVYPPSYTSVSPRFGFSYQPRRNGNTVIRGGVGLFYDTPNLNVFLSQNPGNGGAIGLQGNPAGPSPVLALTVPQQTIVPGVLLAPTNGDPTSCVGDVSASNFSPCGLFSVSQNLRNPHTLNYSLNLQQAFGTKVVFQFGYVGSEGRKLVLLRDINQPATSNLGNGIPSTTQQANRPYYSTFPNYAAINEVNSIGVANYNSLQALLKTQSWHGIASQISYTWGHNLDDGTQYRSVLPQDSTNVKGDYGNSDYDVRNTFSANLSYEVPRLEAAPHWLVGGWQLNSLLSIHGGQPFSVLSSNDNSGTGEGYQRAVQVSDPHAGVHHQLVGGSEFWINPTSFTDGPTGTFAGASRRNQLYGPGYEAVDFSVFKTGTIRERVKIQFRAELFNLFNHYNFAPPLNVADGQSLGQIYDTIGDYNGAPGIGPGEPFNTQFGLKVLF